MAANKTINILLLGLGNVGRELVIQVLASPHALTFTALADSQGLIANQDGLSQTQIRTAITTKAAGMSLAAQPESLSASQISAFLQSGSILVDASASSSTVPLLKQALAKGCGVVLANKNPLCGAWQEIRDFFASPNLRCESTVGAGLPVIATLRDLIATGDTITSMEGCLSGTLGFLCTRLEQGIAYSAAVAEAKALGYTEPDPRQDMSGHDVARKAVILARTAGIALEMDDLPTEKLYSDELAAFSKEDFLSNMATMDAEFETRLQPALTSGKVPRYVARISPGGASVGLQMVNKSSALGALQGPDNYIAFTTRRYVQTPLVIAGPGAGAAVTATGVFSDILHLAAQMNS